MIPNFTYEELSIGQSARLVRTLTMQDIQAFAAVLGDTTPSQLDSDHANATTLDGVISRDMWGGALISALLGTQFPGPGSIHLEQDLHFMRPVRVGDTLSVIAIVVAKEEKNKIQLHCTIENQKGEQVLHGMARIVAPTHKMYRPRPSASPIQIFDPDARFRSLLNKASLVEKVPCAVVHPCDAESLWGAIDSAKAGLIIPLLIGPSKKIKAVAQSQGIDLEPYELIDVAHSHAAADKAADLAIEGRVEMMMKGSLHTDELIHAI